MVPLADIVHMPKIFVPIPVILTNLEASTVVLTDQQAVRNIAIYGAVDLFPNLLVPAESPVLEQSPDTLPERDVDILWKIHNRA